MRTKGSFPLERSSFDESKRFVLCEASNVGLRLELGMDYDNPFILMSEY